MPRVAKQPSRTRIQSVIAYNPKSGRFAWQGEWAGFPVQLNLGPDGHIRLPIPGPGQSPCRLLLASRVAWFLAHGVWLRRDQLQFANGKPSDLRLANLRVRT